MKEQIIKFNTAKLAKECGFVGLFPTTKYILCMLKGEMVAVN